MLSLSLVSIQYKRWKISQTFKPSQKSEQMSVQKVSLFLFSLGTLSLGSETHIKDMAVTRSKTMTIELQAAAFPKILPTRGVRFKKSYTTFCISRPKSKYKLLPSKAKFSGHEVHFWNEGTEWRVRYAFCKLIRINLFY